MADYSAPVFDFQAHATGNDEERNFPSSLDFGGGSADAKTSTNDYHLQTEENTAKRRRGRPQGSKNKPKPPIVVARDSDPSPVKTVAFEISRGFDVIERIISFACRNHVGIGIISATGFVSNVNLCNGSPLEPPIFLPGTFELHSLIGSFFPEHGTPPSSNGTTQSLPPCHSFRVTLERTQFQLIGGRVFGKLEAATQVLVVAAVLENPTLDDNEDRRQRKKACNANGAIGSFGSTGMATSVYGGANPAPPNLQFTLMPIGWGPSQKMN
ncbi:AT-hook motif nuclear-localized protein 23-like [Hibiscus syriacus]|uniref:AT-hook motif nuclear-localized protein 23-like n=1 Tax=Hibiscus syriacus TaxID=106335 RepID=UPI00192261DA|nr:AT-hook motif nuclear-localized protein 23-like [Hibiscus syriacus]